MPSYLGSASSGICPGLRACRGRRAHSPQWYMHIHCHGDISILVTGQPWAPVFLCFHGLLEDGDFCKDAGWLRLPVMPWGHQRAALYLLCLGFGGEHSLPCFSKTVVSVHKSSSSSFQVLHDLSKVSLSLGTKARKTWRPLPPSPYSLLWDKGPQRRQGHDEQGEGKVNTWKWYSCHKNNNEHDLISSYTHLTDKENWGSEKWSCLLKAIQLIHGGSTVYNQVCLSSNCPPPCWAL